MPADSFVFEVVENGEGEGSGFACAGLGLTDHIHAGEHEGDHARLNGGRLGIAEFSDRLHDLITQVEGGKIGCHLYPFVFVIARAVLRMTQIGMF
jgi:hypothetical protein